MKHLIILPIVFAAGCTELAMLSQTPAEIEVTPAVAPIAAPVVVPKRPPPPPPQARTVAQFDTTTAADRAAAVAKPEPAGETKLGTTIATLGSPADPGIWLLTPLVSELTMGRAEYAANGKSVNLELRPSGKEKGAGSQISLPAMRLLDAPLAGLLELSVYKN